MGLPSGFVVAALFRHYRNLVAAIVGAAATSAFWAVCYGVFGPVHDWKHMAFSAFLYALVAFIPALTGVAVWRIGQAEYKECMSAHGTDSVWWLGAIASPIAGFNLSILAGALPHHNEIISPTALALTIGCVGSLVFKRISRREREKFRFLANFGTWPSIIWLAFFAVLVVGRFGLSQMKH